MKRAAVYIKGKPAGILTEKIKGTSYTFNYHNKYTGLPVSLSMPVRQESFIFNQFPPFFDGLLPEGYQLEALLKIQKLDENDYFSQIIAVGDDLVGAVTLELIDE